MEAIKYFDEPRQVKFVDEEGTWQTGIAYCGEIICGCCGGIFDIEEIYKNAPKDIKFPIHPYSDWNDISYDITGGELPNTLEEVMITNENCVRIEIKENI